MKVQRKIPVLVVATTLAASGASLAATVPATAAGGGHHQTAKTALASDPLVIKLKSTDNKTVISKGHFRPGVTEFRVTKTAKKGSTIVIVEAANLERSFKLLNKAFQGGSGSADAMAKVDQITTFYSGARAGGKWQVKLSKGKNYYAIDTRTNNVTPFKVGGERRGAHMQHAQSEITATKDNMWKTDGAVEGPWVKFTNNAHEVHFMEADHVKESTTDRQVRKALKSNGTPKWILPGGFFFEIESPGVTTVHRTDVPASKLLLICFMPSEEQDGVPHAFMGMWKLNRSKAS